MSNEQNEYTKYLITYKQEFDGEYLTDSFIKHVYHCNDLNTSIKALYADPHVYDVSFEVAE